MPDVVSPDHPRVREAQEMGPEVYAWRHQRERLSSVCLFHGVHEAIVSYSRFIPVLGGHAIGKPIMLCTVTVMCWSNCGYRLEWRA